jgi:hypothetical protein
VDGLWFALFSFSFAFFALWLGRFLANFYRGATEFEWGQGNKNKYLPKHYSALFVQFIDAGTLSRAREPYNISLIPI